MQGQEYFAQGWPGYFMVEEIQPQAVGIVTIGKEKHIVFPGHSDIA